LRASFVSGTEWPKICPSASEGSKSPGPFLLVDVEPAVGFEPTTYRLQGLTLFVTLRVGRGYVVRSRVWRAASPTPLMMPRVVPLVRVR
jgi:hypothetical protein